MHANRTSEYGYNGDGKLVMLRVKNGVTGDQETEWEYGVGLAESDVASSLLLRRKVFPGGGGDEVLYAYNRRGQVKLTTDQLGTEHTLEYDGLGRLRQDRVTELGEGVADEVLRLGQTYEVRGLLAEVTSYNHATVGSGSVVNQVLLEYNDFGQLVRDYQEHDGEVDEESTKVVEYGYADGSDNTVRRTEVKYPNGRELTYYYGSSGSKNEQLSRVGAVKEDSLTLFSYTYLGLDQVVEGSYEEPGVELTYIKQGEEPDGDAGDKYTGLDRFGRVVDQRWVMTETGTSPVRVEYGFDRASNRQWRADVAAPGDEDEYYRYDGLSQVKELARGNLNGSKTGISGTPVWEEDFWYDPSGNWQGEESGYVTRSNGTVTLDQNRTHDEVNEVTDITTAEGPEWAVPEYDAAGNMKETPLPVAMEEGYACRWDAWQRLVQVKDGDGLEVGAYEYDGLGRRTRRVAVVTRNYYYSDQWQILEEWQGGLFGRQYVWGLRYADDLVFRDRAEGWNDRLYMLSDYFNPVALMDVSGEVVERYGYDAFGVCRVMDADYEPREESEYDWETRYGAYRWDRETGLYQVRNRYYHPNLGRWLSRDPIGEAGGINLYAYVGNNGVNGTDYLGLDPSLSELFWLNVYENGASDAGRYARRLGRNALHAAEGLAKTVGKVVTDPLGAAQDQMNAIGKLAGMLGTLSADPCARQQLLDKLKDYASSPEAAADAVFAIESILAGAAIGEALAGEEAVVAAESTMAEAETVVAETTAETATATAEVQTAERTNGELVQEIANRAEAWGTREGLGSGPRAGTLEHGYADRLLTRYQQRYGDRGLSTEVSYRNGQAGVGGRGSIRLDVVEGPINNPTAIYDYKFGNATLTPSRISQIRQVGQFGPDVPINGVYPN